MMKMPGTLLVIVAASFCMALVSCTSTVTNPRAALADRTRHDSAHLQSLQMLSQEPELNSSDLKLIEGIVWRPRYSQDVRRSALNLLWRVAPDQTVVVLRRQLPRMTDWPWLTEVCEWVADRNIVALDPALVSSWGRPRSRRTSETDRPEYLALVQMHGKDRVAELVFELFLSSNLPSQRGLRQRCWDLLHRIGERDRLIELASKSAPGDTDVLLIDLHEAASTFGMVPHNREEIIWLQKLRMPERSAFWNEAAEAVKKVPLERRATLEMRDLSVVVASARHRPELLDASSGELMSQTEKMLRSRRHYHESRSGLPGPSESREWLRTHASKVTWGDLAAMQLAFEAMRYPQVRSHLFDYADRDHADESTEYGGIISLDESGRFEVLEFLPRERSHDLRFNAPQSMFDSGYTSLFHFHFHVQEHRNADHAGPGLGDMNYADNTRANCLVFSFVNKNLLNVDFYRHDGVIVDLGTIERSGS